MDMNTQSESSEDSGRDARLGDKRPLSVMDNSSEGVPSKRARLPEGAMAEDDNDNVGDTKKEVEDEGNRPEKTTLQRGRRGGRNRKGRPRGGNNGAPDGGDGPGRGGPRVALWNCPRNGVAANVIANWEARREPYFAENADATEAASILSSGIDMNVESTECSQWIASVAGFVMGRRWDDQAEASTQNTLAAIALRLKRSETVHVAVGFMRVVNEVQLACKIDRYLMSSICSM
jgi:hypothetical protein